MLGDLDHFCEGLNSGKAKNQQENISHKHSPNDIPEYIGGLIHQQGAGVQSMNIHSTQHNGCHRITGNAHGQHGNTGAAHRCVIRRFAGHQSFNGTFSKGSFGIFCGALGVVIGH